MTIESQLNNLAHEIFIDRVGRIFKTRNITITADSIEIRCPKKNVRELAFEYCGCIVRIAQRFDISDRLIRVCDADGALEVEFDFRSALMTEQIIDARLGLPLEVRYRYVD